MSTDTPSSTVPLPSPTLNGLPLHKPIANRFASTVLTRDQFRTPSPYRAAEAIDTEGHSWPAKGTKARKGETAEEREERLTRLAGAVGTVLECIGEDPEREGLLRTPMRFAKALMFFTKGYEENLIDIINEAVFEEDHDEMVIVKNIDVFSLCEHHMVPFTGKVRVVPIREREMRAFGVAVSTRK